ncbi:DUF6444 domain-containing protein [Streptomyces sp. NPDC050528]|uniref:DUF6444 domain-containing protein n=1 Tax=Streptomyces sp. NPDC050528 TaxID=3365623 RepID=UPI003789C719
MFAHREPTRGRYGFLPILPGSTTGGHTGADRWLMTAQVLVRPAGYRVVGLPVALAKRQPSYDDDLVRVIADLQRDAARRRSDNVELRAKNAELRRLLAQDSLSSSKPPSSDSPFRKPAPRSQRDASGRPMPGLRSSTAAAAPGGGGARSNRRTRSAPASIPLPTRTVDRCFACC